MVCGQVRPGGWYLCPLMKKRLCQFICVVKRKVLVLVNEKVFVQKIFVVIEKYLCWKMKKYLCRKYLWAGPTRRLISVSTNEPLIVGTPHTCPLTVVLFCCTQLCCDCAFSHHYQGSIDFNTVNILRTIGMYFLVFTGNTVDIGWYDIQRLYYPILSLRPRESTRKCVPRDSISPYSP